MVYENQEKLLSQFLPVRRIDSVDFTQSVNCGRQQQDDVKE